GEEEAPPQVQEPPAPRAPPLAPRHPGLAAQPPAVAAPPPGVQPKPAYLGIAGQTVHACRYPAGVRITRVIEGSPAQQAGLKGEGTWTWPQAMAGVLTLTPLAPFVLPFVTDSEHGGSRALVLPLGGQPVPHRH